ncbi:MAG: hypothetical protein WKF43_00670 [Acidimicrobiales bacterium]
MDHALLRGNLPRSTPLVQYQAFRRTPQFEKMHAGGLIGSPDTIRTKLRKFEASHVTR